MKISKHNRSIVIALIMCALLCASTVSFSFGAIENAFSEDLGTMIEEYEAEYSWDKGMYYTREWTYNATTTRLMQTEGVGSGSISGDTKLSNKSTVYPVKMERRRGYQDYYLDDNVKSTLITLGLGDVSLYEGIEYSIPQKENINLSVIAGREVGTKDNGYNKVKYNTWLYGSLIDKMADNLSRAETFDFNASFVSWCLAEAGTMDVKTGNIDKLFASLKAKNECKNFSNSLVGGGTYYIQSKGDIVFFANPQNPSKLTAVGIVSSASENSINLIVADMKKSGGGTTGKVEKVSFSKEQGNIPAELKAGYSICLSKPISGQNVKGIN